MNEATLGILSKWLKDMERTTNWIRDFAPSALPTFAKLGETLPIDNVISIPFSECGICLAPSMTTEVIKSVLETYAQGKKRAIPAILEGFYRRNNYENLRQAVDNWSSYKLFSPRAHIFQDALDAHITGKWTLSIPTLIPHIEGIAGEVLLENRVGLKKSRIIHDVKGASTYPSSAFGYFPENQINWVMGAAIDSLLSYLEGILYVHKDFKDYPKIRKLPQLNRHAILHGYQINYATRLNSLRCFLALDSLSILEGNLPKLVNTT